MTTMTHDGHLGGVVNAVTRVASHLRVTVPASSAMRDTVLADFRRTHGLDLSDDDRAAKIRAKRS